MALWRQTDWLGSMWRQRNRSQKTPVVRVPATRGGGLLSHPFARKATAVNVRDARIWHTFSAFYVLYACCTRLNA